MWLELLFFDLGLLKSVAGLVKSVAGLVKSVAGLVKSVAGVSLDLAVVPATGVSPLADDGWEGGFCDARCGFGDAALID